jgi:hypothetical protein
MACIAVRSDPSVPAAALAAADVLLESLTALTADVVRALAPQETTVVGERAARSADGDARSE